MRQRRLAAVVLVAVCLAAVGWGGLLAAPAEAPAPERLSPLRAADARLRAALVAAEAGELELVCAELAAYVRLLLAAGAELQAEPRPEPPVPALVTSHARLLRRVLELAGAEAQAHFRRLVAELGNGPDTRLLLAIARPPQPAPEAALERLQRRAEEAARRAELIGARLEEARARSEELGNPAAAAVRLRILELDWEIAVRQAERARLGLELGQLRMENSRSR